MFQHDWICSQLLLYNSIASQIRVDIHQLNMWEFVNEDRNPKLVPVRFSWSHFEFLGLMWLSHHQEYLRLESACATAAMTQSSNYYFLILITVRMIQLRTGCTWPEDQLKNRWLVWSFLCLTHCAWSTILCKKNEMDQFPDDRKLVIRWD